MDHLEKKTIKNKIEEREGILFLFVSKDNRDIFLLFVLFDYNEMCACACACVRVCVYMYIYLLSNYFFHSFAYCSTLWGGAILP